MTALIRALKLSPFRRGQLSGLQFPGDKPNEPTPPDSSLLEKLIALHWVMALLIVAVFALIELREIFPKAATRAKP